MVLDESLEGVLLGGLNLPVDADEMVGGGGQGLLMYGLAVLLDQSVAQHQQLVQYFRFKSRQPDQPLEVEDVGDSAGEGVAVAQDHCHPAHQQLPHLDPHQRYAIPVLQYGSYHTLDLFRTKCPALEDALSEVPLQPILLHLHLELEPQLVLTHLTNQPILLNHQSILFHHHSILSYHHFPLFHN